MPAGMLRSLLVTSLLLFATLGSACGRTDIALAPGADVLERELELDDDMALVEVHAGDDAALRTAFLGVPQRTSLDALVATLAMGDDAALVLDTTATPVLVLEVDGAARAYIWR